MNSFFDYNKLQKVINPFIPNTPFLYPLKTSENLRVFSGLIFDFSTNQWAGIGQNNGLLPFFL